MDSANDPPTNRELLDTWMTERKRQLRIKQWLQVAERAGMSDENLRKIRRGEISISENSAYGIEDALQWQRGDVERAVLDGVKPTPRDAAVTTSAESTATTDSVIWTSEMDALYHIIKAKFMSEGIEMNERNVLSAIDQLRIELLQRVSNQDRIPNDAR